MPSTVHAQTAEKRDGGEGGETERGGGMDKDGLLSQCKDTITHRWRKEEQSWCQIWQNLASTSLSSVLIDHWDRDILLTQGLFGLGGRWCVRVRGEVGEKERWGCYCECNCIKLNTIVGGKEKDILLSFRWIVCWIQNLISFCTISFHQILFPPYLSTNPISRSS